jgi:predicted TPR repeat methyltransferase
MYLAPAVIVHDAIIAYSKAKDIEKLYDHYQEAFYDYLNDNYNFQFPLSRAA